MYSITIFYTSILVIIFLILSVLAITARVKSGINLGLSGEYDDLTKKVRAHGNFTEYIPLAIIMLLLAESAKLPGIALHIYGIGLVLGRLVHAFGIYSGKTKIPYRVIGMSMTLTLMSVLSIWLFFVGITLL